MPAVHARGGVQASASACFRILLVLLLVLSTVSGGACSSFRVDIAGHEARIAQGGRIVETRAGPIQYGESGSGAPVLVIHGTGGGFDQGLLIGEMLLGDRARILAPSRFGYLDTPLPPEAGAEAQAEAHHMLLDALDVEEVAVVGFSAGAPSAVYMALQRPERVTHLVLIVPALGTTESGLANLVLSFPALLNIGRGIADLGYWTLNKVNRPFMLHSIGVPPSVDKAAPPDERRFATDMLEGSMPVSRRLAGVQNDARVLHALNPLLLDQLTVPTLAMCARDDRLVGCAPAKRVAAAAPSARLEAFESGGHLLLGRHDAVRRTVEAFLELPAR